MSGPVGLEEKKSTILIFPPTAAEGEEKERHYGYEFRVLKQKRVEAVRRAT